MAQTATLHSPARTSGLTRGGRFITLEGGEGAGKSVQVRALAERLTERGLAPVCTREPGGTPLGERLREILLDLSATIDPLSETHLFVAARAELVATVIAPALAEGGIVICDRFADSTLAYQGYGRGIDISAIERLNDIATGGLRPDLTVLLDLEVDAGLERSGSDDRFEREERAFHERVRAGYRALAEREPERWLVVDAAQPQEAVTDRIWARVEQLL